MAVMEEAPAEERAEMERREEAFEGVGGEGVFWGLALVALLAQATARGFAPALPGIWVGSEGAIHLLQLVGAGLSQLFSVGATVSVLGLTVATVGTNLPTHVRALAAMVGIVTMLGLMIASATTIGGTPRLVLAVGAAVFAGVAATYAARRVHTRATAIIIGVVSLAACIRILSLLAVDAANALPAAGWLVTVSRTLATLSVTLVTTASVAALAFVARTPSASGLFSSHQAGRVAAAGVVVLAIAAMSISLMQFERDPEAGGFTLLLSRALEELRASPTTIGPTSLLGALEAFRWLAALVVWVVTPRQRILAAAVTLALVSAATPDVPSCAGALVAAAMSLAVFSEVASEPEPVNQ